jgi:hypothetical protein
MNVKKIVILNVFILYSLSLSAQGTYLDFPNAAASLIEQTMVDKYEKELNKTNTSFMTKISPALLLEIANFVSVDLSTEYISFSKYRNSCNNYLSPISRKKCNTKLTFLEAAYDQTNMVLYCYLGYDLKTNHGLELQIRLKYISIMMNIQSELDNIKEQAINRFGFESIIKN